MVNAPEAVRRMMADDAASRLLGIELLDCTDGRAVTRMQIREDMVNGHGIVHGGLVFALADTAFACACNSWGPVTVAAAAEIAFVASGVSARNCAPKRRCAPASGAPASTT